MFRNFLSHSFKRRLIHTNNCLNQSPTIFYNLSYSELFHHESSNQEGQIMKLNNDEIYSIDTGKFTGRSPKDKWIVKNLNSDSETNIWWGDVNQSLSPEIFDRLYSKAKNHFDSLKNYYVYDGYCGSNPKSQKKIRFIHELAWQQHFVKNMFIDTENQTNMKDFNPDFTIMNACSVINEEWKEQNLNSEVAVAFNIEKKLGIILGTWYGGENKKGIFSLMNYWLPLQNIMSMHCSANIGKDGDIALFFGLSGTGKTTLSVDPNRKLIGDDEHGWDEDGIFNLEGGCYAKTINLSKEEEPFIYKAIRKNALLENVSEENQIPNFENTSKTENGRVSYPIYHIDNYYQPQIGNHPKNIIFLTCDAFGVLPPISKLNSGQAMYYFLNGYTAKVAGTERGIQEPQATFSSCFGEAFLTLHPSKYAELFQYKIENHQSNVYLVNTGWAGGSYGVGNRISIQYTRNCIDSIFSGEIETAELREDKLFGFQVPIQLSNVPKEICNPIESWDNKGDYYQTALQLADMFQNNYKKYKTDNFTDYSQYGPKIWIGGWL
tara:strand:+ start:1272 stop:2915 length:1644 start_codon:yes stop_codon:yes gene_type:complete